MYCRRCGFRTPSKPCHLCRARNNGVKTDGAQLLALAVITRVVDDIRRNGTQHRRELKALRGIQAPGAAMEWMEGTCESVEPGTFGWWCLVLDLDPGWVRNTVRRVK